MGQWHKPWQIAITIKKIQNDISIKNIFGYETLMGWTNALDMRSFRKNTIERIFYLTNKPIHYFVSRNTINYKYIIDNMNKAHKIKPLSESDKTLLNEDKETLIGIIKILEEENNKLRDDKTKKASRINKIRIIKVIKDNFSISHRRLCIFFHINWKTYLNYKNIPNHAVIVRKDFKHNNLVLRTKICKLFDENKGCVGSGKIAKEINNQGYAITKPTVSEIMKESHLFCRTFRKKFKPRELKDTAKKRDYLINEQTLNSSLPNELVSADFSCIEMRYGQAYLHGIIDIKTLKILSLVLCTTQNADVVNCAIKSLPNTVRVINTDYGTQYFSDLVTSTLHVRNIRHSCGKVGKSTDNRWIEGFWKRLKHEWLVKVDLKNISFNYLQVLLDEYVEYYNNRRIISINNWMSPRNYEIMLTGVN